MKFLPRCLGSVFNSAENSVDKDVYVVDNKSTDGSAEWIAQNYPQVNLIYSENNSGYSGGNNLGWQKINEVGTDYIFLLNQDAQLTDNCLSQLADFLDNNPKVAAVQPKILLWPETDKINSLGNVIHYLGFGYASCEGLLDKDVIPEPKPINYCSGSAFMIRPAALSSVGYLFDNFMWMYLEDLDFGWRLWLVGWQNYLVPGSLVYHQYEFNRSIKQYYYFERNRLWIVFKNYRLITLLLLLPAFIFMELGQIYYALINGSLGKKCTSYCWFFKPSSIKQFWHDRRRLQHSRKISDHELLQQFNGRIEFQPLASPLLKYFANPILNFYLVVLRLIVRW